MAQPGAFPAPPFVARFAFSPARTILFGFAGLIGVGFALLSLPVASADGRPTYWLDALFTATSAVCVTGLVVVDTGTHWSPFGQGVVLALIQLGGFGYMTSAMLLAFVLGRRVGLRDRIVLQESLNVHQLGGIVRFTRLLILTTLAVEATGALLLAVRWIPDLGVGRGAYWAVFHAISAFNNAGFDVTGGFRSLAAYTTDPLVSLVVAALIVAGGLGFGVLVNVASRGQRLTLHSKVVLATSAALIFVGAASVFLMEFRNPETLAALPLTGKILASVFHSISARTAGFSTIHLGSLTDSTLMLVVVLMFIGASPGGTGAGIRTTTFVAPLAVILAMIRGHPDPVLFGRRLPPFVIYKAVTIALLAVAFVVVMSILLTLTEGADFIGALFEVVSAFATVGYSTGITPHLTDAGKALIIVTMYTGRVGLLTLAFGLSRLQRQPRFRYPEESIYVG